MRRTRRTGKRNGLGLVLSTCSWEMGSPGGGQLECRFGVEGDLGVVQTQMLGRILSIEELCEETSEWPSMQV